ncbi:redoxin domain-containing protein [Oceanobacillus sp. CAU 1775]
MKKLLIAVILFGMVGWAVYEYAISSNDLENVQANEEVSDENIAGGNVEESNQDETEAVIGLEVGNLAPDFQLATLNGEEAALSDYSGKKVMINFWATWCPPCRAEMPDMEKFYNDTEVEILAINLTETEAHPGQVQQFADEYDLTFPILLDEIIEVAKVYAIQPVPTSYMVDTEGIIQYKTFGPLTYDQMVHVFDNIN